MKLTIEFYGRLKAEFSTGAIELKLSDNKTSSIEEIYHDLCQSYNTSPNIKIIKPILNDTFAEWSDSVKANDVIGFFPPASGG